MRADGISIVDVANKKAVPVMLLNAIIESDAMCKCGEPLEFDVTMSKIRCSDENCKCKIVEEAKLAMSNIGIEDEVIDSMTDTIWEYCQNYKAGCEILTSGNEVIENAIDAVSEEPIEFSDALSLTGIKLLDKTSKSILDGFRTFSEFKTAIDENGLVEIARRLHLDFDLVLADKILEDIKRVIGTLLKLESRFSWVVRQSKKRKQAGGGDDNDNTILTALSEEADQINSSLLNSSKYAATVIDCINEKKKLKGEDALKIV